MSGNLDRDSLESPDPIFRLPRPWWHYVFPCLLGLALFSVAVAAECALLRPGTFAFKDRGGVERTLTRADRWPNIVLWGVLLVAAPTLPLTYALTSPFVIRKHGLELGRRNRQPGPALWAFDWSLGLMFSIFHRLTTLGRWDLRITTWEQIGPCHWGRYNRGSLTIPGPDGLVFIAIPERYRPEVERTLRQFGKWQD